MYTVVFKCYFMHSEFGVLPILILKNIFKFWYLCSKGGVYPQNNFVISEIPSFIPFFFFFLSVSWISFLISKDEKSCPEKVVHFDLHASGDFTLFCCFLLKVFLGNIKHFVL